MMTVSLACCPLGERAPSTRLAADTGKDERQFIRCWQCWDARAYPNHPLSLLSILEVSRTHSPRARASQHCQHDGARRPCVGWEPASWPVRRKPVGCSCARHGVVPHAQRVPGRASSRQQSRRPVAGEGCVTAPLAGLGPQRPIGALGQWRSGAARTGGHSGTVAIGQGGELRDVATGAAARAAGLGTGEAA